MPGERSWPDEEATQPGPSNSTGAVDQPAPRVHESESLLPAAPPREEVSRTAERSSHQDDGGAATQKEKEASLREQQVLDLYYRLPIAARIARELSMSERQVRRIVEKRRPELTRRRDRDERELAERTIARRSRIADWADGAQMKNLDALDVLVGSQDETVQLRAVRLRQDFINHLTVSSAPSSELDDVLKSKEVEISEELRRVRFEDLSQGNGEELDHE